MIDTLANLTTPLPIIKDTIVNGLTGPNPISIFLFFLFTVGTIFYSIPFIKNVIQANQIIPKDYLLLAISISGLLTTILFLI